MAFAILQQDLSCLPVFLHPSHLLEVHDAVGDACVGIEGGEEQVDEIHG